MIRDFDLTFISVCAVNAHGVARFCFQERSNILRNWFNIISENSEELATLITREMVIMSYHFIPIAALNTQKLVFIFK